MYRITQRALALCLLMLAVLGWGAWEARAQTTPLPPLPRTLRRGGSAVQTLGNYLPQVARQHGYSAERLRNLLLHDPDLAVTDQGDLLYTCVFPPPPPGVRAESLVEEAPIAPLATSFQLHSRPGAPRTIFLDFDGNTTLGTQWNSQFNSNLPIISQAFSTDADPLSFSAAELSAIQTAWQRVAEDYAPFDVDVTTEDPGLEAIRRTDSNDTVYGVRVVITTGPSWYATGGGVGYVGTFDRTVGGGSDWPCFVFYDRLQSTARYFAEAASHEAGHTLGLSHDGKNDGTSYYEGAGDWAPIMGAAYYRNVTQWSKGEYNLANNPEDDIAVMVSNGAAIRADDHGNTFPAATTFDLNAGSATGVITTSTDQDVFKFVVGARTLRLRASTATLAQGANLDIALHLYDSQNNHLAGLNSDASLDATLTATVPAGTYYAVVSGTGNGNVLTTGYSNYASLGNYTLALEPPPFTVTSPNGGETWVGNSSQNVTWTTNIAGNVKLEYSTNGGSTWSTISASTPNDGTQAWSVPNSATAQARVRVSSVADPSANDTSDADFGIQSPQAGTLTLTAPNGGETWLVGASQAITWTSSNLSGNVKLEYSTNGGSSWTTISASTANDGTENWTIPNAVTTQAQVRVTSVAEPTVKDSSNASFTIEAPQATVMVLAPNGGESWTAGTSRAITWSSANVTGTIKLEYSTDGGSSWTTISASTANDGTENWTIPNTPSTQGRVRVSSVTDPSAVDVSNANFTLLPLPGTVTVTSPNGGESWVGESTHAITWTSANLSGNVKLEYSLNGGSTWFTLSASTANDGSENWVLPNAPTSQARVRVTSVDDPAATDTSNANFTITAAPTPTLTLTAPNGGESLVVAAQTSITWTSANVPGNVKLEYSTNGGGTWTTISASTANDGAENWTVPNVVTTQARVRVSAVSNGEINDGSNANFAIVAAPVASVTVTSPNGGETWTVGSAQTLTWTSANLSGNVKLEYSTNGGSTWTTIAATTANDGTEPWTVPNAATTQAQVKVTSVVDAGVTDSSNASFTIQAAPVASITVTAPNGGEVWNTGTVQTVTWTSTNVSGNVTLEYSVDGGATWSTISLNTANDGTESWTLPLTGSTQGRVRVRSVDGAASDTSNANFTLNYLGGKLTAPKKANFGTLKLGKTKSVKLVLQNTAKTGNLVVNVSISGAPFRIVSGGGTSTILPKKKLTVVVIFEPSGAGAATGTLLVTSSDPAKPSVSIPLTGKAK